MHHHLLRLLYSMVVIHYYPRVFEMNQMKIIFHRHHHYHRNTIDKSNKHEKQMVVMINKLKSMNVKLNVYSNVFIVKLSSKILQCIVHINNYIIRQIIHFVVHNVENKKQINTISSSM